MHIILASASPRRRQLLEQVGVQFTVKASEIPENLTVDLPPTELAVSLASEKAASVASAVLEDAVVIGADTIVVLDGEVFGKPNDDLEARVMLERLSGHDHTVITGVAVAVGGQLFTAYSETNVRFRSLTKREIDAYIATGEPKDKAGAYAIQGVGALLVEKIDGCYANVVGLPLFTLSNLLAKAGIRLL